MQLKTIKLAHGVMRGDTDKVFDYKVLAVKNSVEFNPGQILTKDIVDSLCYYKDWDVTIVPFKNGDE